MSDDGWRAPGRENGARPEPGEPYAPAPAAGPSSPADPYATPGPSTRPGPYATPSGPGPHAPPSGPGPYGPSPHAGPHPPASGPGPYGPSPTAGPHAPPSGPGPHADAFATSDRHRDRVLGGPGYDSPAYRNDSTAVMAMVFGVIGILVPGVCLLAIAFGHLARRRLRTSYEGGRGLAVAGLAMGYAMTAVWLALFLLFLSVRTML